MSAYITLNRNYETHNKNMIESCQRAQSMLEETTPHLSITLMIAVKSHMRTYTLLQGFSLTRSFHRTYLEADFHSLLSFSYTKIVKHKFLS